MPTSSTLKSDSVTSRTIRIGILRVGDMWAVFVFHKSVIGDIEYELNLSTTFRPAHVYMFFYYLFINGVEWREDARTGQPWTRLEMNVRIFAKFKNLHSCLI